MSTRTWFGLLCVLLVVALFSTASWPVTPPVIAFGNVSNRMVRNDSLLFLGDVMLARHVAVLESRYGADYPWLGINFAAFGNPAVIANFEAPIPETYTPTPAGSMQFAVATSAVPAVAAAGVTHVSTANNHTTDYGLEGFEHTQDILEAMDIESFGSPIEFSDQDVSVVHVDNHTVALVGLYLLERTPSVDELQSLMSTLVTMSDVQIAFVHWGNEYEATHSKVQADQAALLADAGFDVIIGHHPHVIQDIAEVHGVPVVYSLGNYIFDQFFSSEVMTGLLAHITFSADSFTIVLHPVESYSHPSQPQLLLGTARADLLQTIADRSDASLRNEIKAGNLTFPLQSL